jgi:hypothetical protein
MKLPKLAAGAALLAAFAVAAMPTPAPAETAATASVQAKPTAHMRSGKPHRRTARSQPDQGKARHGKRSRIALGRRRHQPAPEPVAAVSEIPEAPVLQETPDASRDTRSARRFREFLSPQSFALALNEDLRKPRLLPADLSGEMADPQIIAATWIDAPDAAPQENAAPSIARDEASGSDSPSLPALLSHSDTTDVRRAVRATVDNEPARMSFLRWFFVAWGGVLTFASALRMAVG